MTTRAGILGLGTGGILLAVLFYPLYVMIPGLYVKSWPPGSTSISAGAVVIACALTVLGGWLAARWGGAVNHRQRAGLGALAGGMAALVVFCGLGAAAAGTVGSSVVLQSKAVLMRADAAGQSVWLEAVRDTVLWTQLAFWGTTLIGPALGAAGGWCCAPQVSLSQPFYDKARPQMALNVSITAVPATALAVLLAAAVFLRVSDVVHTMAQAQGAAPTSVSSDIVNWPLSTALLLYLAAHAALMLVTLHEARQADHRCGMDEVKMAAYVGIAAPLVLGVGLLLVHPPLVLWPVVMGSWLISLGMSARLAWVLFTLILPKRAQLPPPPNLRQAALFGSIARSRWQNLFLLCAGCGLALVFPTSVAVVSTALNLWLIPIQRLVSSSEPVTALVQHLYQAQAAVSLLGMAGAGMILTGLYLFYAALGRWFQRATGVF